MEEKHIIKGKYNEAFHLFLSYRISNSVKIETLSLSICRNFAIGYFVNLYIFENNVLKG